MIRTFDITLRFLGHSIEICTRRRGNPVFTISRGDCTEDKRFLVKNSSYPALILYATMYLHSFDLYRTCSN